MFTIDIKALRNEYNTLSALVEKLNNNTFEKDLTTRAKQINGENFVQVFSERYGSVINVMTKVIGNLTFIIILDETNDVLELSPYIHIKDPNGKIVLTWNIKDEIVTYLPINI